MLLNATSVPTSCSLTPTTRGLSAGTVMGPADKPRKVGGSRLFLILIVLSLFSAQAFPWCAAGHKIIGQIAYDHLKPQAKRYYAHLNQSLNQQQQRYTLVAAAVWMDTLYDPHYMAFKPMHYIDIPESIDGTPNPKMAAMNAVVAVQQAIETIQDSSATSEEKAIALRIILHVVGDIHQPLHTITRVSRDHPKGDRGGNDFHLGRNKAGNTLHRYWDKGGGFLKPKTSDSEIRQMATLLEEQWACPTPDLELMHWVQSSHALALQHAYAIKENAIPSAEYERTTQRDTQQQLVFAGCRLALLLNNLYK